MVPAEQGVIHDTLSMCSSMNDETEAVAYRLGLPRTQSRYSKVGLTRIHSTITWV